MASGFRWLILGELVLGVVALGWALSSGEAIPFAFDGRSIALAVGLTVVLGFCNFGLFALGRRFAFAKPVYAFFDDEIFPMLREASALDILLVAALAGFAEELLFRGLLLPRMGLMASSVLFGFLHGPEFKLWSLALWATVVGIGFGLMYRETGNLAVPILVHGLYDAAALFYIRRT